MSEDAPKTEVRSPGRRRALKAVGLGVAAFVAGRVTSGIGSSTPESPKSTPTPTISKDKKEAVREVEDLSLATFIALSHKEQDQKLKELIGKDASLHVDTDNVTLIKGSSLYYKDGNLKSYDTDDKTPDSERGQLVRESYLLRVKNKGIETTGLNYIGIDIRKPAYVQRDVRGKNSWIIDKPGFYTNYSAYMKAWEEANYIQEYMDNLWIRTDPKKVPYRHVGDTDTRDIPKGTTFKLRADKGIYGNPVLVFQEAKLAPQATK